jgi:hypothetical protein
MLKEYEIEKKVILLRRLVEPSESAKDALIALSQTKMATIDKLETLLNELKKDGFLDSEGNLTFTGTIEAKKAKEEFTLAN